MQRRLAWPACVNVRDLGGLPVASGTTRWQSVIRADNLNRLTHDGRRALVDRGVRRVIDLRDPREIEKFPYPFAVQELPNVDIINAPLMSPANWAALGTGAPAAEPYVMIAELSAANIVGALRALSAAPPGPVVIHCHEGRERTGVVAAVLLSLAGAPDEVVGEDWVLSQPASLKARDVIAVLEYMRERSGGVREFLMEHGMSTQEADALRSRMLD